MGLGIWEVILILGVILVFFGSRKLPQLARSLGEAKKELNKALGENEKEIDVTDSIKKGRIEDKNAKS